MTRHIGLVSAPRRRRGGIRRAREQFDASMVFRRAAAYCERAYEEWYILSTTHHLLAPQRVIGAAEPPLAALCAAARAEWAATTAAQLQARAERSAEPLVFVVYASQRYIELLLRAAPALTFEFPLSGLSLRERLHWYDERLRTRSRVLTGTLPRLLPQREEW